MPEMPDTFLISDVSGISRAAANQKGTGKGLPTPYELTGDPKWDEGGEFRSKFDLNLEKRTAVRSVLGVKTGPWGY